MPSGIDDLLGTTPPSQRRTNVISDRPRGRIAKLFTRYQDAYHVANVIVIVGSICKAIGFILGGLLAFGGIYLYSNANGFNVDGIIGVIATISGIFLSLLFFILGTLICAVGEINRATLDTAVNTSTFLSNEDRARIWWHSEDE